MISNVELDLETNRKSRIREETFNVRRDSLQQTPVPAQIDMRQAENRVSMKDIYGFIMKWKFRGVCQAQRKMSPEWSRSEVFRTEIFKEFILSMKYCTLQKMLKIDEDIWLSLEYIEKNKYPKLGNFHFQKVKRLLRK